LRIFKRFIFVFILLGANVFKIKIRI